MKNILFKNRCYNGGSKHKFSARYTQKDRNISLTGWSTIAFDANDIKHITTYNVYVGDVCGWCGKVVHISENDN